jgi:GNAT superfamily N-acetyltransferase
MIEIVEIVGDGKALAVRLDLMLDEAADAAGNPFEPRPLNLEARDEDGTFLGGISGYGQLGWLFVKLLAVAPGARGSGVGAQLIVRAEVLARANNLAGVYLDTYEFQAPGFYEKLGYQAFGQLPAAGGHPQRIWFCKVLSAT